MPTIFVLHVNTFFADKNEDIIVIKTSSEFLYLNTLQERFCLQYTFLAA